MTRVEELIPLVEKIVRNFCRRGDPAFYEEARSLAMLTLCECGAKPKKSINNFKAYVATTVSKELLRLCYGQSRTKYRHYKKLQEAFTRTGKPLHSAKCAETAGLTEQKVSELLRYQELQQCHSPEIIDHARYAYEAGKTNPADGMLTLLESSNLTRREKAVIRRVTLKGQKLRVVAKAFDVSIATVSLLHKRALQKLREEWESEQG